MKLSPFVRTEIRAHHTFNPQATIIGYIRHFELDDEWGGDSCGCSDDRCIGFHHDADEECGCFPVLFDQYLRSLLSTHPAGGA